MSLETILSKILDATGTFNPNIAIALFVICAIGEFGPSIPYLLETIWLMTGYQLTRGVLSPFELLLFWLVAQTGRQTGSVALYSVSRLGSPHLMKLYKKYLENRLSKRQLIPSAVTSRLKNLSPFSVALGRLFGLRIPLALTLGAARKLKILSLGIVLSSLMWDAVYLFIGATVGASAAVKPVSMLLYSLVGLTALYIITFAVRFLSRVNSSNVKVR